MNRIAHRIAMAAAAAALAGPLAAAAAVVVRPGEGPLDASEVLGLLGAVAPVALWGLPLAYVVFTVVSVLPRFPAAQDELDAPRDASWVERLSLSSSSQHEGW